MLEIGNKAPQFSLNDQSGKLINLKDFAGKKVIVYFYPKDHTPGCTRQACSFRDTYAEFKKRNAVVIGISKDSTNSHANFQKDYSLPFTLLSDPKLEVANQFGVVSEKNMSGKKSIGVNRSTFIIDEKGVIEKIFDKADPDNNAKDIIDYFEYIV